MRQNEKFIFSQIFYFSFCTFTIIFLLLPYANAQVSLSSASANCQPIYVRWPRVRLNFPPAQNGIFSLAACKGACALDQDPNDHTRQQCSAFNHRAGPNQYGNECQIFQKEAVQHTDGYVEADDRYTFYWKYCVKTERYCGGGDFAFTFLSDRYMALTEIDRSVYVKSLEDCLAECLNAKASNCRSVSFNRTDGGCHISEQNQLTKPAQIKINNNPNYRIDYYENNCANISNTFHFHHHCEERGIRIDVDSQLPYTGALYGLYDFFSCRIEPRESQEFSLFFPYPTVSNNCSDSIRYMGNDVVLEVVLSTDGVEPLYFITADDLTYQATCPIGKSTVANEIRKSPATYSNGAITKSVKSDKIADFNSRYGNSGYGSAKSNGVKIFTAPTTTTTISPTTKSSTTTISSTTVTYNYKNNNKNNNNATTVIQPQSTTKDIYSLPLIFTRSVGQSESTTSSPWSSSTLVTPLLQDSSGTTRKSLEILDTKKLGSTAFGTAASGTSSKLVGTDIVVLNGDGSTPQTASSASSGAVSGTTEKPASNFIEALKANSLASIEAFAAANLLPNASADVPHRDDSSSTFGVHPNHTHPNYGNKRRHPGLEAILDPAELKFRDTLHATASTAPNYGGASVGVGGITEVDVDAVRRQQQQTRTTQRQFYHNNSNNDDVLATPTKQGENGQNFSFSTYVSFPTENRISLNTVHANSEQKNPHNGDEIRSHFDREFELSTTTTTTTVATTMTTTNTVPITTTTIPSTTTTTTTVPTTTTTSVPTTTTTTTTVAQTSPITVASSISVRNGGAVFGDGHFGKAEPAPSAVPPPNLRSEASQPTQPGAARPPPVEDAKRPTEPVIFDIFHNGQTTEAVVVGSRITLTFTPYFAIPPSFMSLSGCQVEPIGSLNDWEKEPLAIVKEGCQADHVGLVCPPQRTDFGIRVGVEAFRYQTTTQIQYTCLVRICPFAVCPETTCSSVDGCPGDDILSRSFGLRAKRKAPSLDEIRAAFAENPFLQQQLALGGPPMMGGPFPSPAGPAPSTQFGGPMALNQPSNRMSMNASLQQQLMILGGDHMVRKRLIVVNSEEELQYYVKTGEVPPAAQRRV